MATEHNIADGIDPAEEAKVPTPIILTQEEWEAILEREAQEKFGMSVAEFFEAWKAGKFKDNREMHDDVVGLAMSIPEAWECDDAW